MYYLCCKLAIATEGCPCAHAKILSIGTKHTVNFFFWYLWNQPDGRVMCVQDQGLVTMHIYRPHSTAQLLFFSGTEQVQLSVFFFEAFIKLWHTTSEFFGRPLQTTGQQTFILMCYIFQNGASFTANLHFFSLSLQFGR